ncbi:hypothetical protein JG688_00016585 [Phytophthora aleatoria]|uniref:Uncharacterized protein n=1 Tax=Phytophthora aleatoria TaxID=2496075 RepID=A0A8J5MCC2_9STRA|nr:hypothetical protein JG688_00016585 [Phytophthora aleatoria]
MSDVHAAWLAACARSEVATTRQLSKQFPDCVERGVEVMEFLLESVHHADSGDDSGLTPMMVAILRPSIMTTRCVFRKGQAVGRNLVVDCREEEGEQLNTVVTIVKLLLRCGANVGVQSQDGKTALHCSTSDESYEVAKLRLDAGASGDTQDEAPHHYCTQEGGQVVTDLLLSRRANIDVADADGITPIQFAVDVQAEAVVPFIVDNGYAPVTVYNKKGETAMHRAILRNSPSVMELISDLDLDGDTLTAVTMQRETPAHYASAHGSAREVETLLLCLTRVFGDLEELEQLGETNPLNVADETGMTSLFIAAVSTENGFDSNNNNNNSFLQDRDAKVRLLLDHGGRLFPDGFLKKDRVVKILKMKRRSWSVKNLSYGWDERQLRL